MARRKVQRFGQDNVTEQTKPAEPMTADEKAAAVNTRLRDLNMSTPRPRSEDDPTTTHEAPAHD